MADALKRQTRKEIGPGGINCNCCGPAPGKERRNLRRRARRRLKQMDAIEAKLNLTVGDSDILPPPTPEGERLLTELFGNATEGAS